MGAETGGGQKREKCEFLSRFWLITQKVMFKTQNKVQIRFSHVKNRVGGEFEPSMS